MSSDVGVGLITAGGALAGVVLGGVRQEIRDARRAKRKAGKVRRVALDDIDNAAEAIGDVRLNLEQERPWPVGGDDQNREDREWPAGWEQAAWTQSWIGYRDLLVDGLGATDFSTVARAFGSLIQFEKGLAAGKRPFVGPDRDLVERVDSRLGRAREILAQTDTAA